MYQLEVKRWLVSHKFLPAEGWDVTMDIDAMERGQKGVQPLGKKEIAAECEAWLRKQGVKIVAHKEGKGALNRFVIPFEDRMPAL